ncbi:hypothetical protein SDC9_132618 [bioreactor metagenome]|uniref:Uncharacterized protein n=1 Tax=bioreactor metagenome TaxID=1076179 RepID=A0A645D8K9_9ZZZZ
MAFRPLGLLAATVKVRNDVIQQKEEQHADPKAHNRRYKGPFSHVLRLIDGGNQKAPDGGRHHHPGGKAGKGALHPVAKRVLHEKDTGRTCRGADKRD